jgi:competence protein ComEC
VVIVSKNSYFILQTISGRYYVYNELNTYEVFDILTVDGKVEKAAFTYYESQFNFNEYLKTYGVKKMINNSSITPHFLSLFRIKHLINNNLSLYDTNTKSILSTLLFNLSSSKDYSSLIYSSSLSYYLSISSFHVYFLLEIIEKIVGIKCKEKTINKVSIFFSIFFLIISNYKLSLIKLVLLKILVFINYNFFKNKLSKIDLLGITYIFIGLIFPSYFSSINFYYSLPLYLLLMYSKEGALTFRTDKRKFYYIVIINLYFIPLLLISNGYFCLLSLPFALVISPLILIIFILGLIGLLIPLWPIFKILSNGFYFLLVNFDKVNIKIYTSRFNIGLVILYYLFLFLGIYFIETKRKKKTLYSLGGLTTLILISLLPIENKYSSYISFINVGQGDSTLIVNKGKSYLIDTGGVSSIDLAVETLIPYFKKNGIYKLDAVFITHHDYDHFGALESLKEHFYIGEIIEENNFKVKSFTDIKFFNLNTYSSMWKEENDYSLVLYTSINNKGIMLMGDAPKNIEKKIVNDYPKLKVDILKLGHHGSSTSSSYEFLNTYKPKISIISCGLKNKYNHPNKEVVVRLEKLNLPYRRTDEEGTIKLKL